MLHILLTLTLNFAVTAIAFNLINLIPVIQNFLSPGYNPNWITLEMLIMFFICLFFLVIDQKIRDFFFISFNILLVPVYLLVITLILKLLNPTFEPLELMNGRMFFIGLYFILLCGYPWAERCLKNLL